jgi:HEAT repeat protein
VPDLIAVVKSTEGENLRRTAVDALGRIGPDAKDAIPTLVTVVKETEQPESLRCTAARAIGRLGPDAKTAIPVFSEMLRDPKLPPELAGAMVAGLGAMGKDGVPALAEAVNKGSSISRRVAITQLAELGDVAKPALPALKEAAADKDRNIAVQAAQAARMIEGRGGRGKYVEKD